MHRHFSLFALALLAVALLVASPALADDDTAALREEVKQLREQTQAWSHASNDRQRGVDWQFTIGDARRKLKSLYPEIKV